MEQNFYEDIKSMTYTFQLLDSRNRKKSDLMSTGQNVDDKVKAFCLVRHTVNHTEERVQESKWNERPVSQSSKTGIWFL